MSRLEPRRVLTDAALASALLAATLGPQLVAGLMTDPKPGASIGIPADSGWWLFAGMIMAGLVIRRLQPVAALLAIGAGTLGHLVLQNKFQLLDLALPLALYTVATMARSRRRSLAVLGVVMLLAYAAMLTGQVRTADHGPEKQVMPAPWEAPVKKSAPSTAAVSLHDLIDTGQAVLELWLLMIAAFAVGDGMRSRRAHLAALEQRTADLAREERQRAALAVAAERARITRELHDVVAHGMSVMVVQAQGAAATLERHPERAATALGHVIETGRSSLAEMRRLLAAGRTGPADHARLAPLPGVDAVPALVDQLRSAGMRIDLHIEGVPAAVPAAADLSAYRIVQEALTNTLKHGGPGAGAQVRLGFEPDRLLIDVADDGTGPTGDVDGRGNGLRGIAERVAMLGGALGVGPGHGGGFRVRATLPLAAHTTVAVDR